MAQPFGATRLELSCEPLPIPERVIYDPIFGDAKFSVSANGVLAYRSGVSGNSSSHWDCNCVSDVEALLGRQALSASWLRRWRQPFFLGSSRGFAAISHWSSFILGL